MNNCHTSKYHLWVLSFLLLYVLSCKSDPKDEIETIEESKCDLFIALCSKLASLPLRKVEGTELSWISYHDATRPIEKRKCMYSSALGSIRLSITQIRHSEKNNESYSKENYKMLFPPKLPGPDKDPDIKTATIHDTIISKHGYILISGTYTNNPGYYYGKDVICKNIISVIGKAFQSKSCQEMNETLSGLDEILSENKHIFQNRMNRFKANNNDSDNTQ